MFTHEPPHEAGVPNLRATHAAEMVYVFNNLHALRMIPDRSSPKLAMESARDREVADQMSSCWVNFARTGDPNGRTSRNGIASRIAARLRTSSAKSRNIQAPTC